ncbi:MAG TPA: tyrosine-type recombinase/integrase [Roseiarcus sp.]|jgi:integrase|nr:tyrosine-type recombinase/integrase [Roseiarcus sp.]
MAYGSGLTRGAQLLTHRSIEALRPGEAPYRVPDQRCKGLAVRVAPSGVKTWDLAYRIRRTGTMRRLSLGRTVDVSLEQARERANELTSAARQGRDLIADEGEARDAAASRVTVETLIDLYLRRRVIGRLRTAKTIESRLRRTLTPILHQCAAEICRRDIRAILDAMVDTGKGREAEKRRQVCTAMFRWALSQDIVETDPTAGLEAYDRGTPRDRVLTVEEIETLWKWLDTEALSLGAADILKLELLTGARCGEISGLRAEEIDRQKWTWTLPAGRSKNGRQRVTPIVGLAREMLEQRLSGVEKGPLFLLEKGVVVTSAHIGHYLLTRRTRLPIAVFTSHDLRRTFATMLAEMGIALDLVAAIVGHESGGKETRTLVRHYVRTDMLERKAHALRMWDDRLKAIVAGEQAAKVVRLTGRG